jgi:phage gp16-like protein
MEKEIKRKKLIQLVHVGKAQLGLDEEDYRALLVGVCGKESAAAMTERQLETVLKAMRKNGFEAAPRRVQSREQGQATVAQLEYIKGMWQQCARNKSDAALGALVKRIAGVDALRFLTVKTAQKVILALQDMQHQEVFYGDA